MSEVNIVAPTIHLNGSSAETLINDLKHTYTLLNNSLTSLRLTAPHMRDYYIKPKNENAFEAARKQYENRYNKIQSVMEELAELAIAIQLQVREK